MRVVCVAVVALMLSGCSLGGGNKERERVNADFVVNLDDGRTLDTESELGEVGLTARSGRTLVTIEVAKPRAPRQQAEIRQGNCDTIHFGITYQLESLTDGKSETVVDAPLRELRRGGYLVLVHDVPTEARIGGVCGDLAKAVPPGAAPTFD